MIGDKIKVSTQRSSVKNLKLTEVKPEDDKKPAELVNDMIVDE
jgi:hypothetical protein